MTHAPDGSVFQSAIQVLTNAGLDGMASALELLLNEAMKIERSTFLNAAPYQRSEERRGQANGFKDKTVHARVGDLHLKVPQARDASFYPKALERGVRSERALNAAMVEMYVCGVSTRKVSRIVEELCGHEVSSSTVSRLAGQLDQELECWRNRPLGEVPYLILDARYEKIRRDGTVVTVALFTAIGVMPDGRRCILAVSVSESEAEVHWREFFKSLMARGLHGCRYIVSDDHPGLKKAREACFVGVPWQRCQFHLMQNAMSYLPHDSMRDEVVADLRGIFHATDRAEADRRVVDVTAKYASSAPRLSRWIEENVPEGLTAFVLPRQHRTRMRTSNPIERLNREIKRRTKVVSIFPNDAALLRLASAVLMEIDEDWMSGKVYLNMEKR